MRRATNRPCEIRSHVPPFQSTLSMRRATHHAPSDRPTAPISIHALHEESDPSMRRACWRLRISIHALHEESDTCATWLMIIGEFQSTLSMRRATAAHRAAAARKAISIHALHEESDTATRWPRCRPTFQSTLSMRRATRSSSQTPSAPTFQSTLSMRTAPPIFIAPLLGCFYLNPPTP